MRFQKNIVAGLLIICALSNCKKDNSSAPSIIHSYEGNWKNVVPVATQGPLDYFDLTTKLVTGSAGTLDAAFIQTATHYPQTNLVWKKISCDSVVITLDIPAYPNEIWELRGLVNDANTKINADYFATPKNIPDGKHKYGTLVLSKY